MNTLKKTITTTDALLTALQDPACIAITVHGTLSGLPTLRLPPGKTLAGENDAALLFAEGSDGLQLTADNEVSNLHLQTSVGRRAIFNDTSVDSLGQLRLANLSAIGQVQILAREQVRAGHVEVKGLDIIAADARAQKDQPNGYGVNVTQGAFTLWNLQADPAVLITARLSGPKKTQ